MAEVRVAGPEEIAAAAAAAEAEEEAEAAREESRPSPHVPSAMSIRAHHPSLVPPPSQFT